jgi:hypothetical protein
MGGFLIGAGVDGMESPLAPFCKGGNRIWRVRGFVELQGAGEILGKS